MKALRKQNAIAAGRVAGSCTRLLLLRRHFANGARQRFHFNAITQPAFDGVFKLHCVKIKYWLAEQTPPPAPDAGELRFEDTN